MSDIPRDRVVRYLKIHSQRGFSDHIHSHGTMDGEAVLYASDILALLDENSELLVKRRRHGEERARAEAAEAEVERLRELLAESREYELWSAYQTGVVKDGQWCHCFMTDGEWLAEKCGFDPSDGWYDAQAIRDAIPQAARNMEDE